MLALLELLAADKIIAVALALDGIGHQHDEHPEHHQRGLQKKRGAHHPGEHAERFPRHPGNPAPPDPQAHPPAAHPSQYRRGDTFISRFQVGTSDNSNSEVLLLKIKQPYPNHNGGALAFGPDGYLYAGLGDGGFAGDPHKNGQNTTSLLGKILRLNVDSGETYSIPTDNPFGNEVWAYGLRNPWRISFDRATGDLYIGDVGQGDWEEIDYLPADSQGGANFGWSIMEGNHGYDGAPQPGLLLPVAEYSHNEGGCSVTGGYVYRGTMSEWNGIYLYGDYCSGKIWGLILSEGQWQSQVMFETGVTITTFGQDESGEIYFASDNGSIYHLAVK